MVLKLHATTLHILFITGSRARFGLSAQMTIQAIAKVVEAYKAALAGVWVVYVNPAYTSQACSQCGHCEQANRKSQAQSSVSRVDARDIIAGR